MTEQEEIIFTVLHTTLQAAEGFCTNMDQYRRTATLWNSSHDRLWSQMIR